METCVFFLAKFYLRCNLQVVIKYRPCVGFNHMKIKKEYMILVIAAIILCGVVMYVTKPNSISLNSQTQCAEAANKYFIARGYSENVASYQNHYNSKLNKCFVLITTRQDVSNNFFSAIDMFDALEGKHYAAYIGHQNCYPSTYTLLEKGSDCYGDSGVLWLKGDDSKDADYGIKFNDLVANNPKGNENVYSLFMKRVQPFMNE